MKVENLAKLALGFGCLALLNRQLVLGVGMIALSCTLMRLAHRQERMTQTAKKSVKDEFLFSQSFFYLLVYQTQVRFLYWGGTSHFPAVSIMPYRPPLLAREKLFRKVPAVVMESLGAV